MKKILLIGDSIRQGYDYYIKMDVQDIKKLKLQEDEVSSVEWFSKNEIENLMKQDKFFKNHYEEFEILLKWLDNK